MYIHITDILHRFVNYKCKNCMIRIDYLKCMWTSKTNELKSNHKLSKTMQLQIQQIHVTSMKKKQDTIDKRHI